ncbi:O-antigen ligase family protein [Novosphingobium sp.]|uniref:O-antigen ligase family protein n=1 Tax=Novosphingobium sp. TaxID=1874826 RepID=UPI0038BA4CA3
MDRAVLPVLVLLAASLVLGGGGSPSPLPELLLQLGAAVLAFAWYRAMVGTGRAMSRPALIAAAIFLALPLLQLVPLPPSLWHSMPGRGPEIEALSLIGAADRWRPWSMAPDRTLAGVLSSLPPLLMLVMAASLRRRERALLLALASAVALVSLFVGVGQMRGDLFDFYGSGNQVILGFQANRNTTADILLVGLLAAVTSLRLWNEGRGERIGPAPLLVLVAVLSMLVGVGVFMTGSRAGIALFALTMPAALALAWPRGAGGRKAALGAAMVGAIVVVGLGASLTLSANQSVTRVVTRFAADHETRPDLWRDTRYAIDATMPFGSGVGTFVPVMFAAERLEVVDTKLPNRAHNEYLEYALEGGAFAALAALLLVVLFAVFTVREWRSDAPFARAQISCALAAFTLVALHSMVDYPFRSMSMATLIAVMAALLLPPPERSRAG